jgi:putative ABC transport system ATP-binding protein
MTPDILRAEQLTRVFGSGHTEVCAVDGVSFSVPAGQLLLIMGPSGSGKTTLLTMLGGLLRPTSGSVYIDGTDVTRLTGRELTAVRRSSVGFIFQSFNLLESLSTIENVEIALNIAGVGGRQATERARRLLVDLGLEDRLHFRTRDLSGGEKQRVSIARALANNPRLVLADEPTANLDSTNGIDVMNLLRDIARSEDRAVVAVSHDQRIREVADRVLWLEDGRIRDIGKSAKDPVCGMTVERAGRTAMHAGVTYYFCADGCLHEFEQDPERFLASDTPAGVAGKT